MLTVGIVVVAVVVVVVIVVMATAHRFDSLSQFHSECEYGCVVEKQLRRWAAVGLKSKLGCTMVDGALDAAAP